MNRPTRQTLDRLLSKLSKAREHEASIVNKYSDNFKEYVKASNAINRLVSKYNRALSEYNYDHCLGYNIVNV